MKSKISFLISLIFTFNLFPQEDFKVLSSDNNSLTIEFSPIVSISNEQIDGESYVRINLLFGCLLNLEQYGKPAIQSRQIPIGVPSEFGNTVEVLSASEIVKDGKIIPIPTPFKDEGIIKFKYEINQNYYSGSVHQLITFGDFVIIRGMPVQYLVINPVAFNPIENKIKIYEKIIFRVNFNSSQNINSKVYDTFLSDIIPNFNVAKNWIIERKANSLEKTQLANSVLSTGKWIRFETKEEGIYRITRPILASFGIDPNIVDPRTIKIYNNGGKVLPELVNAPRPTDLVENAILVVGESDGKFDNDDYILFYGRGTNFWDYNTSSRKIKRYFHPYSTANYYWITYGGSNGKRMTEKPSLNVPNKFVQSYTQAFASWEEDKVNIGKTGRVYLGDEFTQSISSRTYITKLDGRIENSSINYFFRFVNASSGSITFAADENNNQLFSNNLNGYGGTPYSYGVEHLKSASYNGALPDSRSVLRIRFSPTSSTSIGYLDYFEITYLKELKAFDDNLIFYSKDTSAVIEYGLSGFSSSNIRVFDITDYSNVKVITNPVMQSGAEFVFQSSENFGAVSKYAAVGSDKYKIPVNPTEIPNQNIRGFADGSKLIIIFHKSLKEQALRLKNYRENNPKLKISTTLVDVNEIYNEFSGGLLDVSAIRDFIKYAYDNWVIKPEYVLLFGDGTYDYKNIEKQNDNLIPPYETSESLNELSSYPIDDFFARIDGNDAGLDIALGRLTVNTASEARIAVDKIINYETLHEKGIWRNLISLVADDNMTTSGQEGNWHTPQSETLANNVIPESFDLNKIYLAAYPTVLTALGRTKPGVFDEIINTVNRGTLILNYVGHGSPDLWAHERVFVKSATIPLMKNKNYFFLTAATCDFGYYDIPAFQSATELLIVKDNSGAIGAFTSSRPVYSFENAALNEAFYSSLLRSLRDTMNLPIAIGKAYMKAKIIGSGNLTNDEKYLLFCDPSLRLNIPQFPASIDSINGLNLSVDVQIKALSSTRIDGVIKKSNDIFWNDFNGEATLTVFDSKRQVKLDQLSTPTFPYYISVQGGIIFRGRISITNGQFSSNFIVPKDISYENANGKILVYFSSAEGDGIGYTTKIKIGGTDTTAVNDGKGPEINVFFDDLPLASSNLINPNSILNVKLVDESGINTTGTGVGHKLEGILNENYSQPIDFTNFFTGDLDAGGKSGQIRYQFTNLEPGNYQMLLKAWDVFNNPSQEIVFFTVVAGNDLYITDVYNYPNPFNSGTTFTFQKNNINSAVDVDVKIYTIAGRLVKNLESKGVLDNFVKIDWDGRDQDGNQIANGTYLYKILVKSTDGTFNKSVLGKLAIVR